MPFTTADRTELQYSLMDTTPMNGGAVMAWHSRLKDRGSLPDPESLWPKVAHFITNGSAKKATLPKGLKMWHWDPKTQSRSGKRALARFPESWQSPGTFVFLGTEVPESKLDVGRVLTAFDTLYPLYQFVESGS